MTKIRNVHAWKWVGLSVALVLGLGWVPPALAAEDDSQPVPIQPNNKKLVPLNRPESLPDGATNYHNDHEPPPNYFFGFATAPPRRPDWGEHLRLAINAPTIEIRSIEFSLEATATTRLVAEFDIWDAYNTASSPVNAGLLRVEELDYGNVPVSSPFFYRQIFAPFSTPLVLGDPDIFLQFKYKDNFGNVPPHRAFRPIADGAPTGPAIGTSENDVYADQNSDGIFTFSAPNAGDRRLLSNTTVCGPSNCQTNWNLHIRGAPNPNVIDPGMDLWETPPGSTRDNTPLPAGFFDFSDQSGDCAPPGFSSLPYTSGIELQGLPLNTNPPNILFPTDTIVRRLAPANLPNPGDSQTVQIEIVALSLQSIQPITVIFSNGSNTLQSQWNAQICLSDSAQTPGSMDIVKGQCPGEGGTFSSFLPVLPKLIFTRVSPPPDAACTSITFDFGINGLAPIEFTAPNGHWLPDAPPGLGLIEEPFPGDGVDGNCDGAMDSDLLPATSNFHPGTRVPRCPKDPTCDPPPPSQPPQKRLTEEEAQLAAHGVLPAEQPEHQDPDGDGVPDPGDNCPFDFNPDQADFDDDGVGDVCDNCPLQCNLDQADFDGDNAGDVCDCLPFDPLNPVPGDPGNIIAQANKRTFTWGPAPNGQDYDVVRGALSALPVGPGFGDEVCIEVLTALSVVDSTTPAIGQGFFYIHRSKNHCGPGTWESERHNNNGYHAPGFFLRHTTTCLPPS